MSDPSHRLRRKRCKNKIRYYTKHDAITAARKYYYDFGHQMDVYYCTATKEKDGGHWHIGHDKWKAYDHIGETLKRAENS